VNQGLDVAFGLALQKIGEPARQVAALAMDDEHRLAGHAADRHGPACSRFVHDPVRHAPERHLDAGTDVRADGNLGEALLEPALVAVEEVIDLAPGHTRRHSDP
jgi:hypothetical protein